MAKSSIVAFFKNEPREDRAASKKEGRPIYVDRVVCVMRIPGDQNRVVVQPANHVWRWEDGPFGRKPITYAERFPEQYERFMAGEQQVQSGTPLEHLPFLTEAKRRTLKGAGVYTAEVLAGLEGNQLKGLGMGGRELKSQAQAFLDTAANTASATNQAATIAALQQQIEELQQLVGKDATAPADIANDEPSEFDDWGDDDLKDWIGEQTGTRPRGNPNHATLVRMAREATAQTEAA